MDAAMISEANASQDTQPDAAEPKNHESHEVDNKFQRAISAWRNINLSTLIQQLDTIASDILAHQRDALVERKEVAQKTKDFRKLDDAGKLSEYKSLLKTYQTFIDLLTTHGKESTSAFLQLYTPLSDAPDPFPLLEASVDAVVASEDTVPRLTAENEELQGRVSRLSGQLEEVESTLDKERAARRDAEDGSGTKVREIEERWAKVLDEKESNWKAKEQALEEKVENQDRLLRELKASYEVSQRLGQDQDNARPDHAATAELEMMSSELDKTSSRLAEIEARNEQLRVELARLTSQNTTQTLEDDPAFLRMRSENSSLLRRLESTRFEKDAEKRGWEDKLKQADRQKSNLSAENQDLRSRVDKRSDYDEIKRELDMLKSLELSTGEDEEERLTNGSANSSKQESLEQVLLARNKKLSNDLTLLRVSHQDLEARLSSVQEELSNTNAALEKSHSLAATLESDLTRVQQESSYEPSISGRTYSTRLPPASSRRGRTSPTSSIISGYDHQRPLGMTTLEQLRSGDPQGGGSGILPMIQAQRDRFKSKNAQLEEDLHKTYATVTALRAEVASLQKDNLNLYEKSRYVSAYSRSGASGISTSNIPSHTSVLSTTDPEDKYHSKYESQFHETPFSNFRAKESTRAYNRMSLPERTVFTLTRIVTGSRWSRNVFAGYCVALHLLALGLLYSMVLGQTGVNSGVGGSIKNAAFAGGTFAGGAFAGDGRGKIAGRSETVQDGFG